MSYCKPRYTHAALAIGSAFIAFASPVAALQTGDDLHRKVAAYTAFIDAENSKTLLCKTYLGTTVAPTSFDLLAPGLAGAGPKNEFETTAQYQRRQTAAASVQPAKAVIVTIPVDRNYVRYDADVGAIMIYAGAFPTGHYSEAFRADLAAYGAVSAYHMLDGPKLQVGVGEVIRVLSTATARTVLGVPIRVTNAERHTKGLILSTDRLFGFARDDDSTIMGFEASQAVAPRLKQNLRTAIVINPEPPYVMTGSQNGEAATAQTPTHYTERSTVIAAKPLCGLVIDVQGKVLATADAGTK